MHAKPVPPKVRAVITLFFTLSFAQGQQLSDLSTQSPLLPGETLIIGFLGGVERWNDPNRGIRKLTMKLRQTPEIHAESFGNSHSNTALRLIVKALDTDGNHILSDQERSQARIILYGQSLGGQTTIRLARALNKRQIPVLLTVQVDSVGPTDHTIPPNVQSAVNFYQRELLTVRGRTNIHAADPQKTVILTNKQFHYPPLVPISPKPKGWARRHLGGAHARMEADPKLWAEVESYIRQTLAKK